jgi:predicted metalloprotease
MAMRWTSGDRDNIDDRRSRSGGGFIPLGIGGVIVLTLLSLFTGVNFFSLVGGGGESPGPGTVGTSGHVSSSPAEERLVDMVDAVAGDVQDSWRARLGDHYEPTKVVLFRDRIRSACGFAQAATGPFYCPADRRVYLDLGFFDELARRFGAPGDFAQAYVVAHEMGHHVQSLVGTEARVRRLQQADPAGANADSVKLELQADCYAGVWGHDAAQAGRAAKGEVELDPGDADEALRAAASIGDDRLQKLGTGHVMPETFTHGTSEQRVTWFRRGFMSGDPLQCETFGAAR